MTSEFVDFGYADGLANNRVSIIRTYEYHEAYIRGYTAGSRKRVQG